MIASLYALELLRFITVSWYSIKAVWFSIQAAWYSLELLGITLKLHGIPPISIRFGFVALSGLRIVAPVKIDFRHFFDFYIFV